MSDPVNIEFNSAEAVGGIKELTSALAQLKAAVASLDNAAPRKLKAEVQGVATALAVMETTLGTSLKSIAKEVETGMKAATAAARKGGKEMAAAAAEGDNAMVLSARAARQKLQKEYEYIASIGTVKLGALKNLKSQGITLSPMDALRLSEAKEGTAVNTAATRFGEAQRKRDIADQARSDSEDLSARMSSLKVQMRQFWADKAAEEERGAKLLAAKIKSTTAELKLEQDRQDQALTSRARRQTKLATAFPSGDYSLSDGARLGKEVNVAKASIATVSPEALTARATIASWGKAMADTSATGVQLTGTSRALSGSMKELHSAARGVASGFGAMWLTWGSILPLLAGAALSNAAAQALKVGADVGQSLATIQNLGGATTDEMGRLNAALLETARNGPFGPAEVAKALKTLSLAGLDAREQIQALKPVLDFAVAGDLPIEKSAESLVAIASAFGYQMKDLSVVSDVVAKTAAISMASAEGMASSFRVASVVAQQYNVSLVDVATSLALLAQVGIKDQAAGTAVRQMYSELVGTSQKARAVMKDTLKFDAFEAGGKALKPLSQIFTELSASFLKLDFKSQTRALQDLGNERGTKALSANLEAVRNSFSSSGKSADEFISKMRKMQEDLADAPGFSAIAAIGMSGSTSNQMKQTLSTMQTALVEAFQSVEPSILRVTTAMQGMFNSREFRDGVTGLVSAVANLTLAIVSNIDKVILLGKVYLTYQASMLAFNAASIAGTAITNAMASSYGRAAVAAGIMNVALATTPAVAGAAATALGLLNSAAGLLGVLALAVTGVYAAYKLFWEESDTGTKKMLEDNSTLTAQTAKGLDDEIKRLKGLLSTKEDALEATKKEAEATREAALGRVVASGAAKIAVLEEAKAVSTLVKVWSMVPGMGRDVEDMEARRVAAIDDQIAAQRNGTAREVGELVAKFALVKQLSKDAADLAEKNKRKGTPGGTEQYDSAAKAARATSDNLLSQIKARYTAEMSAIKKSEDDKSKLLESSRKNDLIGDGQYHAERLQLLAKSEQAQLTEIASKREEYEAQYRKRALALRGTKNESADRKNLEESSKTVREGFDLDRSRIEETAVVRMQLDHDTLQGEIQKTQKASDEFWRSEANNQAKAARSTETDDLLRYASPEARAYISASASETERLTEKVQDYDYAVKTAAMTLAEYQDEVSVMAVVGDAQLKREADLVAVLNAQITARDKLKASISGRAASAGDAALDKFRKDNETSTNPVKGIQKAVTSYLEEIGKMGDATGRIVSGAFKGMEDALTDFVMNGKLDFESLATSIISGMVRITIQQSIMKPFADSMSGGGGLLGFLGGLFSANGNAFGSGGVHAFADGGAFSNSIVTRPTAFQFAKGGGFGLGVMGEAGDEAVMPLARDSSGKLGVRASGGGGSNVVVNVIESPGNGGKQERKNENGVDMINIWVEKIKSSVANDIARGDGAVPHALAATYGLNRVAGSH